MKLFFLNLAILFCTTHLFAQQLTNKAAVGTWKVVGVQTTDEMQEDFDAEEKKMVLQIGEGFMNTKFTFTEGKDFKIAFPANTPDIMKELEYLNNTKWKIMDVQNIAIGTEEDNYSMMSITVRNQTDKTFFILDESPFILEMVKE